MTTIIGVNASFTRLRLAGEVRIEIEPLATAGAAPTDEVNAATRVPGTERPCVAQTAPGRMRCALDLYDGSREAARACEPRRSAP